MVGDADGGADGNDGAGSDEIAGAAGVMPLVPQLQSDAVDGPQRLKKQFEAWQISQ